VTATKPRAKPKLTEAEQRAAALAEAHGIYMQVTADAADDYRAACAAAWDAYRLREAAAAEEYQANVERVRSGRPDADTD
jgi:hypothetical protein